MKLINSGYNEENQVHRSIYQDDGGTFYLVENNVWTKVAPKLNIKPEELTELEIKHIKEQKQSFDEMFTYVTSPRKHFVERSYKGR